MNIVDLAAAAWTAIGAWRGRKRGLSFEAYRLARLGIAVAAGCGLYGLVSSLLSRVLSLGEGVSGPAGFVGTVGGAWWLLRALRTKFTAWVASRWPAHQAAGGAIAGGLRALVGALGVVAALSLATHAPGHDAVAGQSLIGKVVGFFLTGR